MAYLILSRTLRAMIVLHVLFQVFGTLKSSPWCFSNHSYIQNCSSLSHMDQAISYRHLRDQSKYTCIYNQMYTLQPFILPIHLNLLASIYTLPIHTQICIRLSFLNCYVFAASIAFDAFNMFDGNQGSLRRAYIYGPAPTCLVILWPTFSINSVRIWRNECAPANAKYGCGWEHCIHYIDSQSQSKYKHRYTYNLKCDNNFNLHTHIYKQVCIYIYIYI